MSFKRLLGIISVVIIVMFSLMLTTSYAWYSFEEASTTFDVVTNNDDIIISYQKGEYISTNVAVPVSAGDVDKYSEKNNFSIMVRDNISSNEMLVTISLVDISIDKELVDKSFKIDLYQYNTMIASVDGVELASDEDKILELKMISLDNDIENNFEIRVYILDDGTDQSAMMNKTFQAKIKIDAISRLKSSINNYGNPDIYISSITIDGEVSDSLPVSGYYEMTSICEKESVLSWDSLSKTITYEKGSKVNDSCSLSFMSNTDYSLLKDMAVGSYVKYVGTNGCSGRICSGQNANYVSNNKMGYCNNEDYNFITDGFRIGYINEGNVYLISAGALECVDGTNLDKQALKYCNKNYTQGNVCDSSTVWAMNSKDFNLITNNDTLTCNNSTSNKGCGYNNDLIDIGGYYWLNGEELFNWNPTSRNITKGESNYLNGLRTVVKLDSELVVVDGDGSYNNPYVISK